MEGEEALCSLALSHPTKVGHEFAALVGVAAGFALLLCGVRAASDLMLPTPPAILARERTRV